MPLFIIPPRTRSINTDMFNALAVLIAAEVNGGSGEFTHTFDAPYEGMAEFIQELEEAGYQVNEGITSSGSDTLTTITVY